MNLMPLPARKDNYIWMLYDDQRALVVDPGDAQVVQNALKHYGVRLEAILVTHHHSDHTSGVAALHNATGALVYGPCHFGTPPIGDGSLTVLGLRVEAWHVPGHTANDIAYVCQPPHHAPILFCGDTLFSAGCGRLFEGTPAQMLASLTRLTELPDATLVCCGHEYTVDNLRFALMVEPDNAAARAYQSHAIQLRSQGQPTLPSTLGLEKSVNPFLRAHWPDVVAAAQRLDPRAHDPLAVFTVLRTWRGQF